MARHKATARNVDDVLERFAKFLYDSDKTSRQMAAKAVNRMLDEMVCNDFFGTEAQCDPRGDQRD